MRNRTTHFFWFVHQLKPSRGVYAPRSLSQGYLLSVCTQKMQIEAFTQCCLLVLSGLSVPLINATSHHSTYSRYFGLCCVCSTSTPADMLSALFFPPCNLSSRPLSLHPCWKEMVNTRVFCSMSSCCFCTCWLTGKTLPHCMEQNLNKRHQLHLCFPAISCPYGCCEGGLYVQRIS